MGFKSKIIRPYARKISRDIQKWSANALSAQHQIRNNLIREAANTQFGVDHRFGEIKTYEDFKRNIPIRDYEGFRPYIDRILKAEKNILWPGRPKYLAKTSGTTSGVKYIPLTRQSMPNHFGTARNAVLNFAAKANHFSFLDGKMIFLSGSPEMQQTAGIPTGRLSGIVNHQIPAWLRTNQLPSYKTNCIEDWETKLQGIVQETIQQPMSLISGIPPWVQMYFEWLLKKSGAPDIKTLFPDFSVFVYGGVNYEPYRSSMESLIGGQIHTIETYPASEGFIAFQDEPANNGLLLNVDSGIFFEFVPVDTYFDTEPQRISLDQVQKGVNYALLLSTNAGLWAYDIGDTVEFVELEPYRIKVTGRVKHYISAFGEHVIGKEVEHAMNLACASTDASIVEFTVAPQVTPIDGGLPYHEWFVEFEKQPEDLQQFVEILNEQMTEQNIYYKDLIRGQILRPLVLRPLVKDAFRSYMKVLGKLGGQNKVPRLTNDRKIAEALSSYLEL